MNVSVRLFIAIPFICISLIQTACSGSDSPPGTDGVDDGTTTPDLLDRPDASNAADDSFVVFESGQVRPLALSADGTRLFVTNTPNATLDIFSVSPDGIEFERAVPVGLEPVAVAIYGNEQAWVVNHLSDSISIIDLEADPPRVIDTLLTGDEPRDIVFAGADNALAFVTTAHRGQNGPDDQPIDAQLFTPSVGRADVWVFDARARGLSLGGDPVTVLSMFGDTPRALTVSPDGNTVYAAVMNSGNLTSVVGENNIAKPGPVQSSDGELQPDTGLIIKFDGDTWRDATGAATDLNNTSYDSLIRFSLPDIDVFAISATDSPVVVGQYTGVGTTLFNMVTNPATGAIYVSNTEALNLTRFEGEGNSSALATVRGNIAQSRITIINGEDVNAIDLNRHLDHTHAVATDEQRRLSMAQPLGMAITADGSSLYVAGFGSQKIAVYDTAQLANDAFEVSKSTQIPLSGGGPTAVMLDEAHERLYVMTRFNNSIATIDLASNTEVASIALQNPEPSHVIEGRPFLYNAEQLSSHGDASCGLCHVFGDTDALAWDLGNPDQAVVDNPNRFVNLVLSPDSPATFHPLKGPMTTQSLRGLANSGPMHWRGDRTGQSATDGESIEHAAFVDFNIAFPELLGTDSELNAQQMDVFADFALEIHYPPNPIRALDNSLTPAQEEGRRIYMQDTTTGDTFTCNDCHVVDPEQGQFGTGGDSSIEGDDISQEFKVPHLRNMYQKVGKFGNSGRFSGSDEEFDEQIKGFGFMHDGNMDTLDNFLQGSVFRFDPVEGINDSKRQAVNEFVMAMDAELAPIVGQQITLSASSGADSEARLNLLLQRAAVTTPRPECDLIAKGIVNDQPRGFVLDDTGVFVSDNDNETYSVAQIKQQARTNGGAITFTCVPPGSGVRLGIESGENGSSIGDTTTRG